MRLPKRTRLVMVLLAIAVLAVACSGNRTGDDNGGNGSDRGDGGSLAPGLSRVDGGVDCRGLQIGPLLKGRGGLAGSL